MAHETHIKPFMLLGLWFPVSCTIEVWRTATYSHGIADRGVASDSIRTYMKPL